MPFELQCRPDRELGRDNFGMGVSLEASFEFKTDLIPGLSTAFSYSLVPLRDEPACKDTGFSYLRGLGDWDINKRDCTAVEETINKTAECKMLAASFSSSCTPSSIKETAQMLCPAVGYQVKPLPPYAEAECCICGGGIRDYLVGKDSLPIGHSMGKDNKCFDGKKKYPVADKMYNFECTDPSTCLDSMNQPSLFKYGWMDLGPLAGMCFKV